MIYVLDTSALKWAYLNGSKFCRRCRYILSHCEDRAHIAEITILEIVSALGAAYRGRRISTKEFSRANVEFLRDVSLGRLIVVPLPSSEFIACRYLLTFVGIDAGRNLETQDAIIAYTARRLALEKGTPIRLLTSDRRLARMIREVSIFKQLVTSEYLDPN